MKLSIVNESCVSFLCQNVLYLGREIHHFKVLSVSSVSSALVAKCTGVLWILKWKMTHRERLVDHQVSSVDMWDFRQAFSVASANVHFWNECDLWFKINGGFPLEMCQVIYMYIYMAVWKLNPFVKMRKFCGASLIIITVIIGALFGVAETSLVF